MKQKLDTKWNHLMADPISQTVAPTLHIRSDLHLARKAWHFLMGLLMVFIYMAGMSRGTAVLTLGLILAWDLCMEMARLRIPALNERILKLWGPIMRHSEANRFSAVPHYLFASMLAVAVFPKPVAVLSILYLACGDPIASLFGILYGSRSIRFSNGKSLVGTAAGIVTCALVTLFFLNSLAVSGPSLVVLTLLGGFAGGTVELLPLELDDNLTIPIVSGFVMWLGLILCGL